MAVPGTATVTAKVGPGLQATAVALAGVTSISIDFRRSVLQVYQGNELTGPAKEFEIAAATTITVATPGTTPVVTVA